MFRRLVFITRLVVVALLVVVVFDALVFRSSFYWRWLEPGSVAGSTRNALRLVEATTMPGRRNVLVVGNSRIGEGLSMALADQTVTDKRLHFVNGFIPGSDLRIWYYLLREVDPDARRYSAIVLATPLAAEEELGKMANRAADINYLAPLLRLGDLPSFASSFDDPVLRNQAARAILFPMQPMRRDLMAFLSAPLDRYRKSRVHEKDYVPNYLRYLGRNEALPDLPIDPSTRLPAHWSGVDERMRRGLTEHYFRWLHAKPPGETVASNERYYRYWLDRIVERYQRTGVPIILIAVPRGPWHGSEGSVRAPGGAIGELIAAGKVLALPGDTFTDVEKPPYFFDQEHMNRAGRERFTVRLAQRLQSLLP